MPQHPLTVLNVNSDKAALYFSSRVLRDAHFRVLEAETIQQASALARQRPDLIIVDTRLEKTTRCEICRAAQTTRPFPGIPVLYLVSGLDDVVGDASCPLGMRCGNLHWPASAGTLLATVRELLMPPASAEKISDEHHELLGRLTLAASYQVDRLGIVLEWGSSAERLFGWNAREAVGRFLPTVDDEHRGEFLSMLASALRGQPLYRWESERRTKNGQMLTVAISMLPIFSADDSVNRVQIVAADISETRRLQTELQQLSSVVLSSEDFICIFRKTGEIEFINPAGLRLIGLTPVSTTELGLAQIAPAATCARIHQVAVPRTSTQASFVEEMALINADGNEIPVSLQVVRLGPADSGRLAIVARDIRVQKATEQRLQRLNRIHLMLGKCSQAIQKAADETSLFAAVCHLLTDIGGYRFAMVSLMFPDPEQKLLPASWSGDDSATPAELLTYWNPDHPRGQGPSGTAARTGKTVIRHDVGAASDLSPWAAINARLGLRAAIALPLIHGTQSFGVLSIYAAEARVFDAEETRLLEDLSKQFAHGMHALRAETERNENEATLRLFSGAIESTLDGVMITDAQRPDHPIVYVNPAFTRITGWENDEVLGKSGRILVANELQQPEMEVIRHALRGRTTGQAVLRCFRKDGQFFWNELHVAPIRNARQETTHYVSVISDVSERILREGQLAHLAMHDPLTGLANRTLLNDRLRQAIARADRDERLVALLLIDLDRFKQVNDSLGHGTGDMLLHMVASRLKGLALESDTLARLGGDEFVLLLTDLENELDVPRTGQMLIDQLSMPFEINGEEIVVTPSIGAAIYPLNATDPENLLRLADVAMYSAKESGRNTFRHFAPEMNQRSQHQLTLEKDLRHALERNELVLYYQPKADLYSGNITGCEALIRWQHPEHGLVPPAQFIPLAEASGIIVPIGSWVLREACRQAAQWQREGLPPLRVAVNLSPLQFRQPDLVEQVAKELANSGLDPCWLELEVTESLVMDNPEAATDFLNRLKKMGVRLAMDDFGTGYSSLSYLKRFPFDVLKIDRSFVQNIVSEPDDAVIAVAVIAMAHSLGLHVIAEGVEDEAQMRYLRSHLCDEIQGYLFSRPLPAAELAAFLRDPRSLAVLTDSSDRQERTLLLVDDEPDILNSLKRLLRRSGYRILTAGSGAEGLELLALNSVQVIVSDQRMPIMNGSEFLSRVKSLYPDTMRIVLSGYTELAALTDAINRGAIYKFVTKPWDDDELREVIREAFITHGHRAGTPDQQADGGGI
jgi:diguanylate cyclase (GGDEF)-like protein/PAS domain S-box-containing protein